MTVFSGMLIATILGVLPDPDALRAGREADRQGQARGTARRDGPPAPTRRGRPLMTRHASSRRLRFRAAAARGLPRRRLHRGPELQRPEMPGRPPTATSRARRGAVAGRPAVVAGLRRPGAAGLDPRGVANNLDLRIASARVVEARALAGIAKSFLYPEVGVGVGDAAQQVSRLSEPPQGTARPQTYQNWAPATLSWEIDLFGRLRRGEGGGRSRSTSRPRRAAARP